LLFSCTQNFSNLLFHISLNNKVSARLDLYNMRNKMLLNLGKIINLNNKPKIKKEENQMKNLNVLFLLVVLFAIVACENITDTNADREADIQANKELAEKWDKANNAGNTDAIIELYVDNPIRLLPNEPIKIGKEAVRSSFESFYERNEANFVSKIEDIVISGDYAMIRGSYTGSQTVKASGQSISDKGKWVELHQRQADGSWKVMYDMENSDLPLSEIAGIELKKGNVLGVHTSTITLKEGVTMEQYEEFSLNIYIPEFEKNFPGIKLYLTKGIRGEDENSYGIIFLIESEEVRNKYWPEHDQPSELARKALEKLQPVIDEFEKLATESYTYTDWVVH